MIFSKALLAKGLVGLAMIGTGSVGIISTKAYLENQLTKYDQALIDHLDIQGADIKFSVKDGSSDITDNFPSFTGSETEKTATIKVKIKTNGTTGGDEGEITEKTGESGDKLGTRKYLAKKNGGGDGTDWTWICEIKFTKDSTNDSGTELKNKDKLVKSSGEKGFFNKLKEESNQDIKKHFIRKCAGERDFWKRRKINSLEDIKNTLDGLIETGNELKITKEFKLVKGETIGKSGDDASKLFPVNEGEFNNWFGITN